MSVTDLSAVLDILRQLYRRVQTLEEFVESIVFKEGRKAVLVEQTDTSRFKSFVGGVFVCFDNELQQVPSCAQICTFPELLAFVLNTVKRKKKRNVLANGYNFLSLAQEDRDADLFKFQGEITQSAAYVHGSDLWKKVTIRLGTDLTRYLLESCSVFMAVPPSCVFQVCGGPAYDRVSMTGTSSRFCLQSKIKNSHTQDSLFLKWKRTTQHCPTSVDVIHVEGGPSWRSGTFPPLPSSQCFIRTLGLMYGGRGMRSFLLNRKRKSANGSQRLRGHDLVRVVFFEGLPYLNGHERKPKKLPRRFFHMVPLFHQLLQQHRSCPYGQILQRLCSELQENITGYREINSQLSQHCAPHRVYLFVRECLSAVIPKEFWGSNHNRLQFFVKVRGFLNSGKCEKLSLAQVMWKIKVNDCDWLKISKTGRCPPSEYLYRTQILGQFLAWLLDGYVTGLVRACFYVTECVGQKNALRFYRHEVWARLQDLAFKGHLSKGQMEEMTSAEIAALPKGSVISRLRFIPKSDGMRPITRVIGADAKTRVYQGRVRDLLDVLRACVRRDPSLLGCTVWGMNDIHKVLRSLAPAQKEKPQPLYFVKVDVSGAYESLPHNKLKEVINQVLLNVQDELLTIRRFAKIWADSHEGLKKSFMRQANFLEDNMSSTNMKGFSMSLQKNCRVHHAILVEQHFCADFLGNDALQFFTQMLDGSVVQFGKKKYRQSRGIPQGSVASSLLCCLCYGHMENALLKGLTENKGCLMRLVDDFLLITPNLHEAQQFLQILLAGVPQYGLVVNPQKVAMNFRASDSVCSRPGIRVLPSHCLFPWCGLLLDTQSLDVFKDYSSYAGLSLRYSLTLGSFQSAGLQMRRKLMAVLRLKFNALFLDLKVNSLEAVYKNIYKSVLLHACRFHVCAQSLPFGQSVARNPDYFLQMIWDMAEYANNIIRVSNKGGKAQTGVLQYEAVELLFCLSFLLVMTQHRSTYKHLLPRLNKRKRSLERRLGDLRLARVRQAANPRIPVDFLPIQM
uniref:Telomerase reverse transcriptase n=1 Tax=Gouania willdenowi TaxID=441366 RepID=A0A8C5EWV5_GOUWI